MGILAGSSCFTITFNERLVDLRGSLFLVPCTTSLQLVSTLTSCQNDTWCMRNNARKTVVPDNGECRSLNHHGDLRPNNFSHNLGRH